MIDEIYAFFYLSLLFILVYINRYYTYNFVPKRSFSREKFQEIVSSQILAIPIWYRPLIVNSLL